MSQRSRATRPGGFPRACNCSMFGGRPHTVNTQAGWRQHLALRATDIRNSAGRATDPLTILRNGTPATDNEMEGIVYDVHESDDDLVSLDQFSSEDEENAPDSHLHEDESTDDEAHLSPLEETAEELGLLSGSSTDGDVVSNPSHDQLDESTDEDILPSREEYNSDDELAAAMIRSSSEESVGQNDLAAAMLRSSSDESMSEDDFPLPAHAPQAGYPTEDNPLQMNDDHIAQDMETEEVHVNLNVADNTPSMSDKEVDESDLSDPLEMLNLLDDENSEDSEVESDPGGRVGQMSRGFADRQLVEDDQEEDSDGDIIDETSLSDISSSDEAAAPSIGDLDNLDFPEFDYKDPCSSRLTESEMLSYALNDIHLTHQVSREAAKNTKSLINSVSSAQVLDYRTVRRRIEQRTGVKEVTYDCCPHSHMSYAMYPELESCMYCGHPRWKSDKKDAYATYSIIPITHRARLWYSNPTRAAMLVSYRYQAEKDRSNGLRTDFWSSDLYIDLRKKGLFAADTDIGFMLSTDGVKVFKSRRSFNIWPLLLVNLNLPPNIRFKRRNLLLIGFIPGPNNPKDMESFLFPVVQEFRELENGIKTWNASKNHEFKLRAYICVVAADMPGREKLLNFKGNRGTSYCPYCYAKGVHNRSVYCPLHPPKNPPISARQEQAEWKSYNATSLPMRTDADSRKIADHIVRTADDKAAKKYGIRGPCFLSGLKSIDIPRSFPPDAMHLWWENVIPDLVQHWRGKFFSEKAVASIADAARGEQGEGSDIGGDSEEAAGNTARTRGGRRGRPGGRARGRGGRISGDNVLSANYVPSAAVLARKFVRTDDSYNIAPEDWTQIGLDMEASAKFFPSSFGDPIRNFTEHCHHLKAAEWKIFTLLLAPIYLKHKLPDKDYNEFINLIEAISLCCDYEILEEDLEIIEQRLVQFVHYYESTYYRERWERLSACLPVFHQILHVVHGIRWAGPMYVYWQWPMERVCGVIAWTANSRVQANRNMAITMTLNERRNHLPYVMPMVSSSPIEETEYEDSDGNLLLHKLFIRQLQRGPGAERPIKVDGGASSSSTSFGGPSREKTLNNWHRRAIKDFLNAYGWQERRNMDAPYFQIEEIPQRCTSWASCTRKVAPGNEAVRIVSSTMKRSNANRSSSHVLYTTKMPDGSERSAFGEIQFFFTYTYSAGADVPHEASESEPQQLKRSRSQKFYLAYIQQFRVHRDGRLLYQAEMGTKVVIEASDIRELIGLIKNQDRFYITRKSTCLF